MALSAVIKIAVDGSIAFADGTGTPLTLACRFTMGDLSISGLTDGLQEAVAISARGKTRSLRKGAPVYPTVSFSAHLTEFQEATTGTLVNWAAKISPFNARVNTHTIGDLDCWDVTWTIEGTAHGDSADHAITCEDVHWSMDVAEGDDGNTFSLSGTVYGNVKLGSTVIYTAPRES